jgi:hypothetical protein
MPEINRAYGLGERNPDTLPDGSRSKEDHHENEAKTRRWNAVRAWASKPGGKCI